MVADETHEQEVFEWGEERLLLTRALRVDNETYQRPLVEERAKQIAAKFDARLMGRLLVNQRKDRHYYVVDGQHRRRAAQLLGITLIPCTVYYDLTVEQEAVLFARWNEERKRPSVYQAHHAMSAGDESDTKVAEAHAINDILAEFGCELVERNHGSGRYGRMGCVRTVYNIYRGRHGGEAGLRRVLRVVTTGWLDQVEGLQEDAIRGVYTFLWRYGKEENFREEQLVKALRGTEAKLVLNRAHAKAHISERLIYKQVVEELRLAYNKGRPKRLWLGLTAEEEGEA